MPSRSALRRSRRRASLDVSGGDVRRLPYQRLLRREPFTKTVERGVVRCVRSSERLVVVRADPCIDRYETQRIALVLKQSSPDVPGRAPEKLHPSTAFAVVPPKFVDTLSINLEGPDVGVRPGHSETPKPFNWRSIFSAQP